jgi:hypothetical protein
VGFKLQPYWFLSKRSSTAKTVYGSPEYVGILISCLLGVPRSRISEIFRASVQGTRSLAVNAEACRRDNTTREYQNLAFMTGGEMENNSSLGCTKDLASQGEPWCGLLNSAAPSDHIVQLYQDQQFLNRAVCRFAAAAIANGEGVILVPTVAHWDAFRPRLESEGVDVKAAEKRGQLTIVDADNLLPTFMRDGMPDSPVFLGLAQSVVSQARGDGRYPKVRWWGEMVNILWERGEVAASMQLEDQFDQLAHEQDIAIFCSFLMDNFDGDVHARMLPRLGENHSHLIPVEDYSRLERAVSEALRDAVGPDESRVLEGELLSRFAAPFKMPRSQALLLALRLTLPVVADDVLQRSRTLYRATG